MIKQNGTEDKSGGTLRYHGKTQLIRKGREDQRNKILSFECMYRCLLGNKFCFSNSSCENLVHICEYDSSYHSGPENFKKSRTKNS